MGTCNVYCRQKKGAMLVFDVWGGLFCFWLLICFPCIYLYFPLILLRFLVSLQCFLRFFHLFPLGFFLICLSFCYVFFSVCSIFFGFVVFSSQFAAHFAIFRVAASQISRFSSILRLQFWNLFLSIGFMLVSFRYISCRFYTDLMFSFDFGAFWFHFASLLLGSGWQTKGKTWLTDFRIAFFAQLFPQWFTMFTSFLDMSISFLKIDLQ